MKGRIQIRRRLSYPNVVASWPSFSTAILTLLTSCPASTAQNGRHPPQANRV
jgi:hypothetical protein